ncbi:hypothetical protein E5288_WYG020255 [Bos mutus]|uniref:NAD-dependent protein deacetylase sirtuin-2 n=1 Tax=Bos mutus TaxID=72004 RepID=A0A6B0S296_9CETA|nr:hypothetical protein [Bos mutus]
MADPDPSDPEETQAGKVQEAQDSDSDTEAGATGGEAEMDFLRNFFSQTLGLGTQKERLLDELTLEGVSRYMQSERCRRVICLVGAGISTSAGIPDFRSPNTGLYANLEKYRLPYPEAIFEISYFKKHPEPFFALAKELYPGQFKPTICHYFIRLLKEKGLLLRCYTQNIDTLERVAGLEPEDLVEAHGTFYTSHCISSGCRQEYSLSWMKEKIFSEVTPKCEKCQSVVKPDIVFFGENLPARFFSCMQSDFLKVDLLIIMGTSLQVQPFASLIGKAPLSTPRLLINKEKTGQSFLVIGHHPRQVLVLKTGSSPGEVNTYQIQKLPGGVCLESSKLCMPDLPHLLAFLSASRDILPRTLLLPPPTLGPEDQNTDPLQIGSIQLSTSRRVLFLVNNLYLETHRGWGMEQTLPETTPETAERHGPG